MKRRLFLYYHRLMQELVFRKTTLESLKYDLFYLDKLQLEVLRELGCKLTHPVSGQLITHATLEQLCVKDWANADWVTECHAGLLNALEDAREEERIKWKTDSDWSLDELTELLHTHDCAIFPDRRSEGAWQYNRWVDMSATARAQLMDVAERVDLSKVDVYRLCKTFATTDMEGESGLEIVAW